MNSNSESRGRTTYAWPAAGIVIAVVMLAATTPVRARPLTLSAGVGVWCGEMAVLATLAAHPVGARVGVLLAGLLLPLPAFVAAFPLTRLLLACVVGATFVRSADFVRSGPVVGVTARLAHLCAWFDARQVGRRPHTLDAASLRVLATATAVLAAAINIVKAGPAAGPWLPVRWLAGGVGLLALAEMAAASHTLVTAGVGLVVPPLFRSPYRSTSVGEFWASRWNLPASAALREHCFAPLARHGPAVALVATFAVSAAGHALLAGLALESRGLTAACAGFFLVQPLVIAVERRAGVRRWPLAARRAWTLTALAVTSPLVVEPVLQIVEKFWGPPHTGVPQTAAALGFCIALSGITSLAAFALRPAAVVESGG